MKQKLDNKEDLFLLDARNEDEFSNWRIESRHPLPTANVPYFAFIEDEENSIKKVPRGSRVVVLCAKGGSSDYVAQLLRDHGYEALNVAGGMLAWGNLHKFRPIVREKNLEIYQIDRVGKGCLSYVLITPAGSLVIDPSRHIKNYLDFASEHGSPIRMVVDTHAHADHISGAVELARTTQAPYFLHPFDGVHPMDVLRARFEFEPLWDGKELELGGSKIRTIHTPGHTLGEVSLLINEKYLVTGDTLFICSAGRPDLGGKGEPWSHDLYSTLFHRMKTIPENALVLPGHYSNLAEAKSDGTFAAPLGEIKSSNDVFKPRSEQEFVQYIMSSLSEFPKRYVDIKRINLGLLSADEEKQSELELGKNVCAMAKHV